VTGQQFYDWQTAGGAADVTLLVDTLAKLDVNWCMISGLAVNHWAEEPVATADVDLVVALDAITETVAALEAVGFVAERFEWSVNLKGHSKVSVQISTEEFYREFPGRSIPADIHGIPMRVASLDDTMKGKVQAWRDPDRRRSKRQKDLTDILRLIEAHPELEAKLPADVQQKIGD